MSPLRPLTLALACAAALPGLTRAQAGMLVGPALEIGNSAYGRGVSLTGTFGFRTTARLGMRFDLGVQTFNSNTLIAYACPRPPLTCGATGGQGLTVVSSTANVVLTERPQERNSFYWMAGLGAYALNDGPYEGAYTRFGWNGGGGIRFGSNIVIEFRYHRLINPRTTRGFVPIAVGFHL